MIRKIGLIGEQGGWDAPCFCNEKEENRKQEKATNKNEKERKC